MTTVRIPLSRGMFALIDQDDEDLVAPLTWHARRCAPNTWYAGRTPRIPGGGTITVYMHSFLTGFPYTDHANGDGLDNRRCNLRPATRQQNQANRKTFGGTSKYKGVCWDPRRGRWYVNIYVDGRTRFLGRYTSERIAAEAYDAAARQHFGEFAALNFPRLGERSALQ